MIKLKSNNRTLSYTEMQETKELPEGYTRAVDLPRSEQRWEPLPEEAYKPKRRRGPEIVKIESLAEALELFKWSMDATKLNDVKLGGMRIGGVFRKDGTQIRYLVLFKREFYFHFSKHFTHVVEQGYGVLANMKLVHWSALEGVRVAAIFPDGRCYWIDGRRFWDYYEENETECPYAEGEIATPLSLWQRLF